MEVRQLTETDAEAYWQIRLRMLKEHPEAFGRAFEESVERPTSSVMERFREDEAKGNFIVGAFDGQALVGTVGFGRDDGIKLRHKGTIWGVYVAAEARGKGVARALMREAIERASMLPGLEQINLAVASDNAPARNLYLSFGFEVFGYERHAMKLSKRYVDEEHMVLHLGNKTLDPADAPR